MADVTADSLSSQQSQPRFFRWMAGAFVLIAFGGFTPTYFAPMTSGALGDLSLAVHLHGFLFFGWTLLFLLQTSLIAQGNKTLHRSLGMMGISWATAMVIFGLLVSLLSNARNFQAGQLDFAYGGLLSGSGAMVAFGVLFTLAVRNVRRPDWHRRFMVLATTAILGAATFRLWLPFIDPPIPMWLWRGTQDLPIVALLIYDWRTLGRPHVVTAVFGSTLVILHILNLPIAETQVFREFARIWFGFAS